MAKVLAATLSTSNQGSEFGTRSRDLYSGRGRNLHQSGVWACGASIGHATETQRAQRRAKRARFLNNVISVPRVVGARGLPSDAEGYSNREFLGNTDCLSGSSCCRLAGALRSVIPFDSPREELESKGESS